MSINNRPVCTISLHPSEIWGPNWRRAEVLLKAWGEYMSKVGMSEEIPRQPFGTVIQSPEESSWDITVRAPSFDSGVEKARNHPNPYYRK